MDILLGHLRYNSAYKRIMQIYYGCLYMFSENSLFKITECYIIYEFYFNTVHYTHMVEKNQGILKVPTYISLFERLIEYPS